MTPGDGGIGGFVDVTPTTVYFVNIRRFVRDKHHARVQLQSIGVKRVSGYGSDARYSPRAREDLCSNKFDINDFKNENTIDVCMEYNELKHAYYCKFMINSKDIGNYAKTSNQDFKKNGSSKALFASIRN